MDIRLNTPTFIDLEIRFQVKVISMQQSKQYVECFHKYKYQFNMIFIVYDEQPATEAYKRIKLRT